jgi:hypothetical protein
MTLQDAGRTQEGMNNQNTTVADLISFIVHSLGYWARESLVCVTLQNNRVGWELQKTSPIRANPTDIRPSPTAKVLTLSSPLSDRS